MLFFFFVKHKTAYELRISDWSSDVCSSDLPVEIGVGPAGIAQADHALQRRRHAPAEVTAQAPARDTRELDAFRGGVGVVRRGDRIDPGGVGVDIETLDRPVACLGDPPGARSEARRVGKECVRWVNTRWARYH